MKRTENDDQVNPGRVERRLDEAAGDPMRGREPRPPRQPEPTEPRRRRRRRDTPDTRERDW